MTPEREVDRGSRAQAILEDDLVVGVLRKMDGDAVTKWRKASDPSVRELVWFEMKAVETFVREFRKLIEAGLVAADKIAAREPY